MAYALPDHLAFRQRFVQLIRKERHTPDVFRASRGEKVSMF